MVAKKPAVIHDETFWETVKRRKSIHNQWVASEEWIRLMNKSNRSIKFKACTLNGAMAGQFVNNVCRRQDLQIQVWRNRRKVLVRTESGIKGRNRYFYFITKSSEKPNIPTDTAPYQQAWDEYETTMTANSNLPCKRQILKTNQKPRKRKKITTMSNPEIINPQTTAATTMVSDGDDDDIVVLGATNTTNSSSSFVSQPIPCTPSPQRSTKQPSRYPMPPTTKKAICNELELLYSEKYGRPLPKDIGKSMLQNQKPTSLYIAIAKTTHSDLLRDKALADAIRETFSHGRNCRLPTDAKKGWAAIVATVPQVAMEIISRIACYALWSYLLEVTSRIDKKHRKYWSEFFSMAKCAACMPSKSTYHNWVTDLAIDNLMAFRPKVEKLACSLQTDAGPSGQEIVLANVFDTDATAEGLPFGTHRPFFLGTQSACGKSSKDGAEAIFKGIKTLTAAGSDENETVRLRLLGFGSDSGGGTPESRLEELLKVMGDCCVDPNEATPESCGLHDMQSIVRQPMEKLFGTGGLGINDAPQYLHTIFTLQKFLRSDGKWKAVAEKVWNELRESKPDLPKEVPKELLKAFQQPIMTRWWTTGKMAGTVARHPDFFIQLPRTVSERFVSGTKIRITADNLIVLSNDWNLGDTLLIHNIFTEFVNVHMKWYQRPDPLLGKKSPPGFKSLHRTTRALLMLIQLNKIKCNWKDLPRFQKFKQLIVDRLSADERQLMEKKVDLLVEKMIAQTLKHNKRYFELKPMIRSCFGEKAVGAVFGQFLLGIPSTAAGIFKSEVHQMHVDTKELASQLAKEVAENPFKEDNQICQKWKPMIQLAIEKDIWRVEADNEVASVRKQVLCDFAVVPSTQHSVERHVKYGTIFEKTGKNECTVNICAIASNGFKIEHYQDIEDEEWDGDDGDENEPKRRKKVFLGTLEYLNGDIISPLQKLDDELAILKNELGLQKYNDRRKAIKAELTNERCGIRDTKVREFTHDLNFEQPKYKSSKVPAKPTIAAELLRYLSYSVVGKNKFIDAVKDELQARGIAFQPKEKITNLVKLLKVHEKQRYSAFLRAELQQNNVDPGDIEDIKLLQELLRSRVAEHEQLSEWKIDVETSFKTVTGLENWEDSNS